MFIRASALVLFDQKYFQLASISLAILPINLSKKILCDSYAPTTKSEECVIVIIKQQYIQYNAIKYRCNHSHQHQDHWIVRNRKLLVLGHHDS